MCAVILAVLSMPSVKFLLYFFVPHFQLILGYSRHVCSPPLFITSGFCACDEHMIIGVFSWHYSCDKAVFMAADWNSCLCHCC